MSERIWWRHSALQTVGAALFLSAAFAAGSRYPAWEALRLLLPGAVLISLAALGTGRGLLALALAGSALLAMPGRVALLQEFFLAYAALGLIAYFEARRGRSAYRLVASSLLLYLLVYISGTYLLSYLKGQGMPLIFSGGGEQLEAVVDQLGRETTGQLGLGRETLKQIALLLSPAFFLLNALTLSFFTIWLAEPVLRRCLNYGQRIRLADLRLPLRLIWLFVATLLLSMTPWPASRAAGLNALLILAFLYLFQGLAIAAHFLGRLPLHPLLRGLMLFSILLFPFTLIAALLLGLLDFYFDFRRLKMNKGERHESDSD